MNKINFSIALLLLSATSAVLGKPTGKTIPAAWVSTMSLEKQGVCKYINGVALSTFPYRFQPQGGFSKKVDEEYCKTTSWENGKFISPLVVGKFSNIANLVPNADYALFQEFEEKECKGPKFSHCDGPDRFGSLTLK